MSTFDATSVLARLGINQPGPAMIAWAKRVEHDAVAQRAQAPDEDEDTLAYEIAAEVIPTEHEKAKLLADTIELGYRSAAPDDDRWEPTPFGILASQFRHLGREIALAAFEAHPAPAAA